ncbi:FecR domain-containing protein [Sphingobacterium anhuiense]|uniref:FecR domain-containing protein n=1 Tax=Sphingobacterium anhuiense TaxID=493780 RepID=A0ABW5YVW4_9SPHI
MGHTDINIKELIKKQLLEQLTVEEEKLLEREKIRYTEDEYELMVIEVLRGLGGQLPKGILQDWQPDVDAIIEKAKALKAEKEKVVKVQKEEKIYWAVAVAALLFFGLATLIYFALRQEVTYVLPAGNNSLHFANDGDIPSEESSCMLLVGKSTWIKVYPDHVGRIKQVGDLLISRTKEGVLKIERRAGNHEASTIANLEIHTEARQQCVLETEDGTRIRMNAQTWVRYPIQKRDTSYIDLIGEAYVVTSEKTFIIGTVKGKVTATASDFVIKAEKESTKIVLNNGKLDLYAYSLKKSKTMYCPGDLGVLVATQSSKSSMPKDTLFRMENMDFEIAKMWTRKVRIYKNIPLRAFVEEMSRWEGFTIKRWDCVPKNKLVTASVHYRSDKQEVYSTIRDAGVLLYEERGMLSFCPEDKKNKIAMSERRKHHE